MDFPVDVDVETYRIGGMHTLVTMLGAGALHAGHVALMAVQVSMHPTQYTAPQQGAIHGDFASERQMGQVAANSSNKFSCQNCTVFLTSAAMQGKVQQFHLRFTPHANN